MQCNKWLLTQPPFSLMGLERRVFHICQLAHIFHFSISVDIRAAFIQLAGLALVRSTGPGNKPMLSTTSQTDSWSPLLKTLLLIFGPSSTPANPAFLPSLSPQGQASQAWPWVGSYTEAMGIHGMELFAIGVVIILFMAVLKQFGILEPMSSFEGKHPFKALLLTDTDTTNIFEVWCYCYLWLGCSYCD